MLGVRCWTFDVGRSMFSHFEVLALLLSSIRWRRGSVKVHFVRVTGDERRAANHPNTPMLHHSVIASNSRTRTRTRTRTIQSRRCLAAVVEGNRESARGRGNRMK